MSQVTLYTSNDESWDDPERDPCWAALAEYDPNDPASLLRAREAVRDHFSLPYLPTLCNEKEPGFWEGLWGAAGRWVERKTGSGTKRPVRVIA